MGKDKNLRKDKNDEISNKKKKESEGKAQIDEKIYDLGMEAEEKEDRDALLRLEDDGYEASHGDYECTLHNPCGRIQCMREICHYLATSNPFNRMLVEYRGMNLKDMFHLAFWIKY